MARWNIDNEVSDLARCNRLQMLTDRCEMPAVNELRLRLDSVPGSTHKLMKACRQVSSGKLSDKVDLISG